MQLVAVETIQLDIGHDGALYPCLSLGAWPNRVTRGSSRRTATICTLVIAAFRRLLRQEGAFVHQVRGEPKSVAWWCDSLIEATCQDATKELGVPLMHPRTHRMHCLLHSQLIDTVRVLPTEITTMHLPPVVNISLQNGRAGDRLGVIAVNSVHSAVFREMSYTPSERQKMSILSTCIVSAVNIISMLPSLNTL